MAGRHGGVIEGNPPGKSARALQAALPAIYGDLVGGDQVDIGWVHIDSKAHEPTPADRGSPRHNRPCGVRSHTPR